MLNIRSAVKEDIQTILRFIRELAEYEKMLDHVTADEEKVYNALFTEKSAHAIIAEVDGKPAGHALFFFNYSTFTGIRGLYIEDIYITPEMRHKGLGRKMFKYLANLSVELHCARMEWMCLSWNAPSIKFYEKLGAHVLSDWRLFRLDRAAVDALANSEE